MTLKSTIDIDLWAQRAAKGDRMTYHQGFLARDRDRDHNNQMDARAIRRRANAAQLLSDQGYVTLVQRRLGDMQYDYIAHRTAKPIGDDRAGVAS